MSIGKDEGALTEHVVANYLANWGLLSIARHRLAAVTAAVNEIRMCVLKRLARYDTATPRYLPAAWKMPAITAAGVQAIRSQGWYNEPAVNDPLTAAAVGDWGAIRRCGTDDGRCSRALALWVLARIARIAQKAEALGWRRRLSQRPTLQGGSDDRRRHLEFMKLCQALLDFLADETERTLEKDSLTASLLQYANVRATFYEAKCAILTEVLASRSAIPRRWEDYALMYLGNPDPRWTSCHRDDDVSMSPKARRDLQRRHRDRWTKRLQSDSWKESSPFLPLKLLALDLDLYPRRSREPVVAKGKAKGKQAVFDVPGHVGEIIEVLSSAGQIPPEDAVVHVAVILDLVGFRPERREARKAARAHEIKSFRNREWNEDTLTRLHSRFRSEVESGQRFSAYWGDLGIYLRYQ